MRRRPRWHCVAFVFLVAVLSSGGATVAVKRPARVNVILITVDTVRADHLGCYGARQVMTPTVDGLAHDGVVFERAIAQVPLTWPSHAVILTGTYPFQNGVQDFTGQPLAPRFRSVAQSFKQNGYATGAVVSSFVLDRSWGLARGFDHYDDSFSAESFATKEIGLVDRRASESVDRALEWLRKTPGGPFFLWLHLYDPHSPYDPPEPYRTDYHDHPYDGEIAYADHELGRLIEFLKQRHLYDSALIVFLSDHGESLGEHGEDEHGFFVYDSTVHIPLIVKPPAGSGIRPGRVTAPVEAIAVAPTMLSLARVKDTIGKQFSSPGLFERNEERAAYSETFYPFSSFGWSPLHALQTNRYHYIDAPEPELYDLQADPAESHNLAAEQKATVDVLRHNLQDLLRQNPFTPTQNGSSALSPETVEKLRALGYVAYRSPVSAAALEGGLADPKKKIGQLNAILKAQDAFRAGDFDTGQKLLAEVQAQDPQIYVVPFMLAEAAQRQRKWDEAAAQFRKCLELNPSFDQAMTGLAHALFASGDSAGARQWLEKALDANSQNYRAWFDLGAIDLRSDPAAAATDFTRALSIQPNFAAAHRDLGMLKFEQKDYANAARHLAEAVKLGMQDARTLNFLGISYSRMAELRKAVECYKQALKADPGLAEAHLNLGYAYQQLKREKSAQEEYRQACALQAKFCSLIPPAK